MAEDTKPQGSPVQIGEQLLPLIERLESSGDDARSTKQAFGRYQITPIAAKEYGIDYGKLSDPEYARASATTILNNLYSRFGNDVQATLIAYNAGPSVARKWLASGRKGELPPETQGYLNRAQPYLMVGGNQLAPVDVPVPETSPNENNAPPPMAPGRKAMQDLQDAGATPDEMSTYRTKATQDLMGAGATPADVEKYWGETPPDPSHLNDHIAANYGSVTPNRVPQVASNPIDIIKAGWGASIPGIQANKGQPEFTTGPNAGMGTQLLAGAAQMAGDLPVMGTGMILGATAGAPFAPETGGLSSVVGAGAVGFGLPAAMREIMLDYYHRGEVKSFGDFMQMAAQSTMKVQKEALVGALSTPIGGKTGALTLEAGAKALGAPVAKALGTVADVVSQAAVMTSAGAALDGKVPDAQSFGVAAILAGGFHMVASVTGTGGRVILNEAGKRIESTLRETYRETGMAPWDVANAAKTDPVLKQQLMAEDVDGQPVTTQARKYAPDEPTPFPDPPEVLLHDEPNALVAERGGPGQAQSEPLVIPPGEKPAKVETDVQSTAPTTAELFDKAAEYVGSAEKAYKWWDPRKWYRLWVGELGDARAIDNMLIKEHGSNREQQMMLEDMHRQTYASGDRVAHYVMYGGIDALKMEKDGTPPVMAAAEAAAENGGNVRDWISYMVAKRSLDKEAQGYETGHPLTKEERQRMIDESKGLYENPTAMLQETLNSALRYARDSGVLNEERYQAILRDNPIYISFKSLAGEMNGTAPKRSRFGFSVKDPVNHFASSDGKITNPLLATLNNIQNIIRESDKNRTAVAYVNLAEAHKMQAERLGLKRSETVGLGPGAKPVDMAIAEPGSDVFEPYNLEDPQGATEAYQAFLAQRVRKMLGPTQFLVFRDGKPEVWETKSEDLAALIRGSESAPESHTIFWLADKFADMQRAGIVLAPDFGARNIMRDQITAYIADPLHPPPYVTFLRGVFDVLGKSDMFQDWMAKGGPGSAFAEMGLTDLEKNVNYVFEKTSTFDNMWNVVRHPIQLMRMLSTKLDQMQRVGYYKYALGKGIDPLKAATMSRKSALDFAEKTTSALVNSLARKVPFMKPTILGHKQIAEGLVPDKFVGFMTRSVMAITIPTILANLANYYQDEFGGLPEDRKFRNMDRYWKDGMLILPEVGGIRWRMPYPQVMGPMFGGLTTRFMDHWLAEDPKAFKEWGSFVMAQLLPPFIPSIIVPPIEHFAGRSIFTGKPLMPASMEKASGPMQYTDATTEPAKALSKVLFPLGIDVSPIVLENYAKGYGGTLGMAALKALNVPLKEAGGPLGAEDLPFVNSFMIRNPGMGSQPIQDFYDEYNKIKTTQADVALSKTRAMAGAAGSMEQLEQKLSYMRLEKLDHFATAIHVLQSIVVGVNNDKTMTDAEKIRQTDIAYGNAIQFARGGLEVATGKPAINEHPFTRLKNAIGIGQ